MFAAAVITLLFSYLMGSIPSAYVAGRLLKGADIRQLGDKNLGAANAFRELGAGAGIGVGITDASKGALAVYFARLMDMPELMIYIAGFTAVAGHCWPIFLHFRGGRGASTTLGIMLMLMPREMFVLGAIAVIPLLVTRNVTLTCGFLFAPLPFLAWGLGLPPSLVVYSLALPIFLGLRHYFTTRGVAIATENEIIDSQKHTP